MKISPKTYITAAVLLACAVPGFAGESQDEAKKLREAGDIRPLEQILDKAKQKQPGRVVETELEKRSGRHVYEVKIVDEKGVVHELKYDAKSGELLKEKLEK
ncbi:MAG: PepSY domain-containing protein [Gammaproteobacteria bacterium]|nr:PepSY domain-containing protein [Gammaproteobacteria bacterium]